MKLLSSEARNSAAAAISSGRPKRLSGVIEVGFGQREDDMEVLNVGQQFGLPALEPLRAGERLALRTAAMPA